MELIVRALAFFIVIGLPLFLIFGQGVIRRWLDLRERKLELQAQYARERTLRRDEAAGKLEDRVRVIERIVTERGLTVADEIEQLRDRPAT
jgi:hypothetical protein